MPIAIGYARVSTTDQAETGESLELQQRKIRAAAEIGDYELVDVLVDAGESAKSLHRPSAARLLDLVKARKVDAVIVHKLDRLTRSVRDLADLLDLFDRCGGCPGQCHRVARYELRRRSAGAQHHGVGGAVGTRGHR